MKRLNILMQGDWGGNWSFPLVNEGLFLSLHRGVPDLELVMYMAGCRTFAGQGIEFESRFIDHAQVGALMRACDLIVFATRIETFWNPVLEACACQVPVILPDWPIFREWFDESMTWFVETREERIPADFTEGEPNGWGGMWFVVKQDDLLATTLAALSNWEDTLKRAERARQMVYDNFTWALVARRVEAALLKHLPRRWA